MLFRRLGIFLTLSLLMISLSAMPAMAATNYKVKAGDSLYKIAQSFGTSVQKLQANNKLGKQTRIHPGQNLVITQGRKAVKATVTRGGVTGRGVVPYTATDLDLLARLIKAEADGESYQAQLAVGAVVVNRVQSSIFPNQISSVIYQVEDGHYQFTPVLNGWINKPATADSLRAAKEALTGVDPTNGALYFFVTGTPNRFLNAKPVSAKIDSITFSF